MDESSEKIIAVSVSQERRPATLEQAFGQVLFARRQGKGLSQMDLAVATGYSLRYVGDVERGAKSATLRTIKDLATLLDTPLGMLIVEAEELLAGTEAHTKKDKTDQSFSRPRRR